MVEGGGLPVNLRSFLSSGRVPLGTVPQIAEVHIRNEKMSSSSSGAKPRQNEDAILKTNWQFIYGDTNCIAN